MSDELQLIGVIAKLELKPGDIVILKTRGLVSMETAARIKTFYEPLLPDGNDVIVLSDLDIMVLSPNVAGDLAAGKISVNQARAASGLPPIEAGNGAA